MVNLKLFASEIQGLEAAISRAASVRGFALTEQGVAVHIQKGTDGLSISGDGEYTISYSKKNELFRALALLVGNLEAGKSCLDIAQTGRFETCGVMFDCSRNAVPKVETLIDFFARMALMGLNAVLLYTEDTYEVEGYEYFGYMRGRYSIEELQTLDTAAAEFGIELIPCIQTLAHLNATLHWGYSDGMRDTSDILMIGEERTYELIEAMFKSLRKGYSTKRIHIGMDEAWGVGRGAYLKKNGCREPFEILCEHIERVCQIAAKYDFEPMMWSDMFFRLGSEDGGYYNKHARIPEWVPDRIPENLSMVYWDYYHDDREMHEGMISGHRQLKREIVFAGGIWKWRGMAPGYQYTFDNNMPALASCAKAGVKTVFGTMWGDDGGEISNYTILLGMQLYAEHQFSESPDAAQIAENFKLCTGYDAESFLALGIDDSKEWGLPGLSRQILYQGVLDGLLDRNFACYDLKHFYEEKQKCLAAVQVPKGLEYLWEYYIALLNVLNIKCTIGQKIRAAYADGDKIKMAECADELDRLSACMEELREKAYVMWSRENKMFGFDMFEIRLAGTAARIKTARRRITEWCQGSLERVDELEEKLLWYHSERTSGKLPEWHGYNWISSASIKS